jgi:hypothetical protein
MREMYIDSYYVLAELDSGEVLAITASLMQIDHIIHTQM